MSMRTNDIRAAIDAMEKIQNTIADYLDDCPKSMVEIRRAREQIEHAEDAHALICALMPLDDDEIGALRCIGERVLGGEPFHAVPNPTVAHHFLFLPDGDTAVEERLVLRGLIELRSFHDPYRKQKRWEIARTERGSAVFYAWANR